MLPRETTYKLAGRRHRSEAEKLSADDLCEREIRFDPLQPGQLELAAEALAAIPGVEVSAGEHPDSLHVSYNLATHSCDELEKQLEAVGLTLDRSLFARLQRAMVHFCEETRQRNLNAPARLIKQSSEVYVQAYEHHPHGDHDDTPPDLRQVR
jgi:hypothetical protein